MPEIITTPNALVQTTNGKRFYVYSGSVQATTAETTYIDIDNIGERDIKINMELGCGNNLGSDNPFLRVYVNDIVVYHVLWNNAHLDNPSGFDEIRLIVAANTSFKVTMEMSGNAYYYTIAGHGKYLSM